MKKSARSRKWRVIFQEFLKNARYVGNKDSRRRNLIAPSSFPANANKKFEIVAKVTNSWKIFQNEILFAY